ncbi:MAG: hypothetical protein CYPHOPRED_005630 [Cyphobasidiales sp. Tagirdzhanova-0007]|nr:MAG: hypothetical protein CYPHOPRED_005630 [Cyphobasidiales sp. Tagirdzhanova-0007]
MDSNNLKRIPEAVAAHIPVPNQQSYVALDANAVETESSDVPSHSENSPEDAALLHEDREIATELSSTTYKNEVLIYLGYMAPLLVNQILSRYCTVLGPVSCMGKFGSVQLPGGCVANTTLNILGMALTMGITSALGTLSTKAHGGSLTGRSP